MLLSSAQSNLTTAAKSQLALFTGCTLFVCNKWDRIKPEEEDEVKKEQIAKLSKKLVKLDPKSQIVYLSCTTAQKVQSYGYITEDFNQLITGNEQPLSLFYAEQPANILQVREKKTR